MIKIPKILFKIFLFFAITKMKLGNATVNESAQCIEERMNTTLSQIFNSFENTNQQPRIFDEPIKIK